jgi:histone-lysine N-methyltransferase SETD3
MKSKKLNTCSEKRTKMLSNKKDRSWLSSAFCMIAVAVFIATFQNSIHIIQEDPFGKLPETLEKIGESFIKSLFSSNGLNTSPTSSISSFEEWFRMNGGITQNVVLHAFENMGNGVLATKNIPPKELTLYVPKKIIICRETIFKSIKGDDSKKNKALKRLLRKFYTDEELIAAFLLLVGSFEKKNSDLNSNWTPYFNVLPQEITSPIVFNENEIEELQDQHVMMTTRREIETNKQRFVFFQDILKKAGPFFQTQAKKIDFKKYLWAIFIINSRALSIESKRFLVPFADMFNGLPHTTKRQANNGAHFLFYHRLNSSGIEILSDRFVSKGSQVFEDYGDNDNYLYFVHHGFLMNENPFDCTYIFLPMIQMKDPKRTSLFEAFGIKVDKNRSICITKEGQVNDQKMKLYLNILFWTSKQVNACLANKNKCFESSYGKKHDVKIQNFLQEQAKKQLQVRIH